MNIFKGFVNLFHFNRTNWKAVALCFLTAAIFWLFNALNKSYSTSIRFPLQFEFDESKFAPVSPLPQSILINVRGTGWDLFRKYFGVKVPHLTLPIERPAETRKIVASTLPLALSSQMGTIQINHIVLDTIRLNIEQRIYRKFPIVIDTSGITFKGEMGRIGDIIITPDSVDLSGPKSVIHNIPDPIVIKLPDQRIGSNFKEDVEVTLVDQDYLQRNPPVVQVSFEVGEYVSVTQKIRVDHDRLPWGYVASKDSVTCTFRVPSKLTGKFGASEVYATMPAIKEDRLKRGETRSFLPIVHSSTPYVKLTSVDSVGVKHF